MKIPLLLCLVAGLPAAVPSSHGAILAFYGFTGAVTEGTGTLESGPAFAPGTMDPNVTASSITDAGTRITIMTSIAATAPASAPFLRTEPGGSAAVLNLTDSVAAGSYFSFTVSANAGTLTLTSLTFDAMRGGAGTPRGYSVRSSLDGFTANLSTQDIPTVRPVATPVNIDLSGAGFQGQSSITFRVYTYSPATGSSVDFDNFTLNGSAIPEPSSALLAAAPFALMGLASRRRRPQR